MKNKKNVICAIILICVFLIIIYISTNRVDVNTSHNHIYTTQTVLPTCSTKGYDYHICTDCGFSYKDNYINETKQHNGIGRCSVCSIDYFDECIDYMKANATYLSASNSYAITEGDSSLWTLWSYKPSKNQLELSLTKETSDISIFFITYYTNSKGTYTWGMNIKFKDTNESFQMTGYINASSIHNETNMISYTTSTFPDYLEYDACNLAAINVRVNAGFLQALLDNFDGNIKNWGYTNISFE